MRASLTCLLALLLSIPLLPAATVTSLTLIDADADAPIAAFDPLIDGTELDLATLPTTNLSVRANVDGTPSQVNFELSGAMSHTHGEGTAPYAMYGDSSGDYDPWTPVVGAYSLAVDCDDGAAYAIDFTVVDGGGTPPPPEGAFLEASGLVVMEYEHAAYDDLGHWGSVGTAYSGYTGDGYLEWKTGDDSTSIDSSGQDVLTWEFTITTTGVYQLHMRSRPSHNTEHNDVWIDFPDLRAYKVKNDTDQGNLDGWTKMYNNGGGNWGWQTTTVDNDRHDIWVSIDSPGTYSFRCSGRSTRFAVDRIVLRHSEASKTTAKDTATPESERAGADGDGSVTIGGELKQWHRVDLRQAAVYSEELADPNPFRDYRMNVSFTAPSGAVYVVPGYFATDGQGGDAGNVWLAHLNPHESGTWSYAVSFRSGTDVAVSLDPAAGTAVAPCDGVGGSFDVAASDKSGADFRAPDKGMLSNRGHHYLTYGGSGAPFLYTGPGIPENILGYNGFTNSTVGVGHDFTVHGDHWNSGDPDWGGGAGRNLIGALNYIADQGGNAIYMMSNTIGGDGEDCFPHPTFDDTKDRYDLLKLIQWDIALAHAQAKGIFLHWHLAENERSNYEYYGGTKDSGSLTVERKLSFRMLNAVFGHYNGLKWNLMEECEWVADERSAQMAYIHAIDPYDHPVTYQVGGAGISYSTYDSHLGDPNIDAGSFQGGASRSSMFDTIQAWRTTSAGAGEPWTCAWDEPQKIENDNADEVDGYPMGRRDKMWPCLMGGGDGFMWYIQKDGGGHGFDQRIEDFTIMQNAFNWCGYARDFLGDLPLLEMSSSTSLVDSSTGTDYALVKPGQVYAIFNDRAGTGMTLDLSGVSGTFTVEWFDPRDGGDLVDGTVTSVSGGGVVDLGSAPQHTDQDWAVLVRLAGGVETYTLTVENGSGDGDYVEGAEVTLTADAAPAGQAFAAWTGDVTGVADVSAATTTVTIGTADLTITATYEDVAQEPFGGSPIPIPGRVEAEDYDLGGEGVAYHDEDSHNEGGDYRSDGVDVQSNDDTDGGYNVGWTTAGEWLEYTVDVGRTGTYTVTVRVAAQSGDGGLSLAVDGTPVGEAQTFPSTGGWQTWTDHLFEVELEAGVQILRVTIDDGDFNLGHLDFATNVVRALTIGLSPAPVDDWAVEAATAAGGIATQELLPAADGVETTFADLDGTEDYEFVFVPLGEG